MKTIKNTLILLALFAVVVSCEKEEEEPFSDKFEVTITYKNWFDDGGANVTNYTAGMTVPTGTQLAINTNFGGEQGTGEGIELSTLEVTRETQSGTTTCLFTDVKNSNYSGLVEPIYENTTYTFTLTSAAGEVATQGPFEIKVANDEKILTFQDRFNAYSSTYRRFFSSTFGATVSTQIYDLDGIFTIDHDNFRFIDFGVTADANGNLFVSSPSKFESLGMNTDLSDYNCNYRKTVFQPYTGSIDFSGVVSIFDENTLTYADLETEIVLTTPSESIEIVDGGHFMFETAEGKKGIGMFRNVVAGVSSDFVLVYQR